MVGVMGLQRIDHWPKASSDGQSAEWVAVESCDGEYYRAADVDALLARIREAVLEERRAAPPWWWRDCFFLGPLEVAAGERRLVDARTATDSLLGWEVTDG